jgi:hypothetical protein
MDCQRVVTEWRQHARQQLTTTRPGAAADRLTGAHQGERWFESQHVRLGLRTSRLRHRPRPPCFWIGATPGPNIPMQGGQVRSPGGPCAEPTTNWDDALAPGTPQPRRGGLESSRRRRGPPAPEVDPAAFAWPASGTEEFLGRDPALSQSRGRGQSHAWPDPVNRFGAATCGRINPNLSGARRVRQGPTHRGDTQKA